MTNDGLKLVRRIVSSPHWLRAAAWGKPRPGHPEGTIGRHVEEQLIPFIDMYFRGLPDYLYFVALAYLHDIGKPAVEWREGRIHGQSHSVLSARIATELGAPERLVHVILRNDRTFSYWRKLLDRKGNWRAERWTTKRRSAFVAEFNPRSVDLPLLVRFHRADNGYRRAAVFDEAHDPVSWFENRLVVEGLLPSLPLEGKDKRFEWRNSFSPSGQVSVRLIRD